MKTVVVVVPIYRPVPTANEVLSLQQTSKTLGHHGIVIICPPHLDISIYTALLPTATVRRFDAVYFTGKESYNRLMLSPMFYQTFLDYRYILICQPDVYVFRDDLLAWCAKDFDYIGAPWISSVRVTFQRKPMIDFSKWLLNKVGNGGFSLRKTKKHYYYALLFRPLVRLLIRNEDIFWSFVLGVVFPVLKRPTVDEALLFAFELAPRQAYQRNGRQLPMATHGWERYEPEFWNEFIKYPHR
jgi:Protein of unknown function (DUF5672)